jgi:CRP-like cAMP-binding protein
MNGDGDVRPEFSTSIFRKCPRSNISNVFNPTGDSVARDKMRAVEANAARSETGIASSLKYATPFITCSKKELRLVARLAKTKEVRQGVKLLVEGEQGDTMYVLLAGSADVHKGGRRIAQIHTGDVVGELAALSKGPRNATVTMKSSGEVAIIGRRELRKLIEKAPDFAQKMLETLADRVRELDKKLIT